MLVLQDPLVVVTPLSRASAGATSFALAELVGRSMIGQNVFDTYQRRRGRTRTVTARRFVELATETA